MAGNAITAQNVIVRTGMSKDIPVMPLGESGWDIDLHRMRMGDGSPTPAIIMTDKSLGVYKFDFIDYVEFPQINMLPDGTVDGVDISDLNQTNGFLVRRGDNLWAARTLTNTDGFVTITNGSGVAGNPVINFSDSFKTELNNFLTSVAVDNVTIKGNGTTAAPLFAVHADNTHYGVVEIATDQQTIDGVSESLVITPGGLSARTATIDRTGVVALATHQETIDGTDETMAITPGDLSARTATQQRTGIVRLSTQAEVDAGTDLTTAVSPGLLKHYVDDNIPPAGAGGFYIMNVIQSQSFDEGGEQFSYNTSDVTYPVFLRASPDHNVIDYEQGGSSGGGAQAQGFGPTNIGVKVNGNAVPWYEFTVIGGVIYGVNDYGMRAILAVGSTFTMDFDGTQFSADGVNLFTSGTVIRYTRTAFTPT